MKYQTFLITGATGNMGIETIHGLQEIMTSNKIVAGVRNPYQAAHTFRNIEDIEIRKLDFEDSSTFRLALAGIDIVFLLRPPQLADVPKFFDPFIREMKSQGIYKIIFLSVQGVENQKMIPHYKLEKLIEHHRLDHIFLRPGYFMQNLTTTLLNEIIEESRIYIPGGKLKFNWVDVRDIGVVAAHMLTDFDKYKGKGYEITGSEFKGFKEVAALMSEIIGKKIDYISPSLLRFFIHKKRQGVATSMIIVMIMLHWLPRFGKNEPQLIGTVEKITGKRPLMLKQFIKRNIAKFG